jgi:endo-1,4-beta-xylanase
MFAVQVNGGLRDQPHVVFVKIGTAAEATGSRGNDPNYLPTLAFEYNIATMNFSGVMRTNQPDEASAFSPNNGWDFTRADALVEFAQQHGMTVRGHNLIASEGYNPGWFNGAGYSPEQLYQIMVNRITTVITHFETKYPGVVEAWDVVNEGVTDWCDSIWSKTKSNYHYAPDTCVNYVFDAFQIARDVVNKVNPNIKLFYNDYGGEETYEDCPSGGSSKPCQIYRLVNELKSRGLIDGVGLQCHMGDVHPTALRRTMRQLGQLGLEVQITELDVGLSSPTPPDSDLQAQALVYERFASSCLAEPNCSAIVTWEFMDTYSWLPAAWGAYAPLPFDSNWNRKPAYYGLQKVLGGDGSGGGDPGGGGDPRR